MTQRPQTERQEGHDAWQQVLAALGPQKREAMLRNIARDCLYWAVATWVVNDLQQWYELSDTYQATLREDLATYLREKMREREK